MLIAASVCVHGAPSKKSPHLTLVLRLSQVLHCIDDRIVEAKQAIPAYAMRRKGLKGVRLKQPSAFPGSEGADDDSHALTLSISDPLRIFSEMEKNSKVVAAFDCCLCAYMS
eukprot:1983714-Rhodomonas_salina.1